MKKYRYKWSHCVVCNRRTTTHLPDGTCFCKTCMKTDKPVPVGSKMEHTNKSGDEVILVFGDLHCMPTDTTEVLTTSGWKKMIDTKVNEEILISNNAGDVYFEKPTKKIVKQDEECYNISNKTNFNFESTLRHRNFIKSYNNENKIVTTNELLNMDNIKYITAGRNIKNDTIPQQVADLLYITGFMLGDGTFDKYWKISVSKQIKINKLKQLSKYFNIRKQKTGYTVFRLKSRYCEFVNKFFGKEKDITIKDVAKLSYYEMENFLLGMVDSDGCIRKDGRKTIRLCSINSNHIDIYCLLAFMTGNSCKQGSTSSNKTSTFPSDNPLYSANLRPRDYTYVTKKTRKIESRVTEVGCFTVSTGLFVVRQENQILITGNCPYHRDGALEFLEAINKKYKPTKVICTGDELDNHAMSFHDSDPDALGAGDELEAAVKYMKVLYRIFPEMDLVDSNHGSMVFRKAKFGGIPLKFIRSMKEIIEAPEGWNWHKDYTYTMNNGQDLFVTHGLKKNSRMLAEQYGCCVAQGHYHEDSSINYSSSPRQLIWGCSVGCLVDDNSLAMEYNKSNLKRPILSCVLITNGIPQIIPMVIKDHKWTGRV